MKWHDQGHTAVVLTIRTRTEIVSSEFQASLVSAARGLPAIELEVAVVDE